RRADLGSSAERNPLKSLEWAAWHDIRNGPRTGHFGSALVQTETPAFDSMTAKLLACVVIVACLVLGGIGLIVPIIPGLLFLVIAAAVAAKLSPEFNRTLRRHPTLAGYLDKTDALTGLPLGKKIQVVLLLGVKMLVDGVALLVSGVMRLMKAAER
ncbi:MAG TPA: DUF454 family protein, partial [Gammaproteobacteria bacterium]|nr:DUF454 family protein [Gammaproteobacteria bacterium]